VSVRLDGSDKRTHAKITTNQATGISVRVAPDGRGVIVLDRDDVYAFPLTDVGGEGLTVNFATPTVPLRRLTTEGANYADWGDGGRTIVWSFANHIYRAPTDSVLKYADATKWGTTHAVVCTPLHAPSQPVPSPAHAGRLPIGLPVTGAQVPTFVGKLHASHWPTQSSLQHTPSTQKLDRHWLLDVHVDPALPLGVHLPPVAQ